MIIILYKISHTTISNNQESLTEWALDPICKSYFGVCIEKPWKKYKDFPNSTASKTTIYFYMFPFVISRPSTYTMHSEMFFILPPSLHLNGRLTVSDGKWTFCHNILFSPDNSINVNFPTKIPITYPCYLMVVYQ